MAGNSGSSGSSNFENATHQALYNMVAGADHMKISYTGASLVQAGKEIEQIATELKALAEGVPWEGEGALAFREWSNGTIKESHKLARFTSTTGNALSDAGSALWEAKTMPEPKQSNSVQLDSVATPTARGATGAPLMTDPDREAAVTAMNRLASYYRTAQENIESQEPPNFKPASGFVPDPPGGSRRIAQHSEILDQPTGREPSNGAGGAGTASSTGSSGGEPHVGASRTPVGGAQQDKQVGTSVNSTAPVLPDATTSNGSTVPVHSGSSGNSPGPVIPGPRTNAGTVKPPADRGSATRAPQPNTARPGTVKKVSRSVAGDGIVGPASQRSGTATGRPGLPGGRVIGEEHGVLPPRPVNSGGNPPASGSRVVSEGTASSGQRPTPLHGEAAKAPRGLAMGEDRSARAHGYPGSTSGGTSQGVPGRRFAYEPGGTVGAASGGPVVGGEQGSGSHGSLMGRSGGGSTVERPAPEMSTAAGRGSASDLGGAAGRAQAPLDRAADFTPGGSGLARDNASGDIVPGAPSFRQGRRRGFAQRPEYLHEDDETWTTQDRSVVPPVIE